MRLTIRLNVYLAMVVLAINVSPLFGQQPNILVIMADDLGFSDLGCYGGEIATPNLDQLAANGLRFTQFYNTGRCWPTRGALLTGYYAQQIRRDKLDGVPGTGGGGKRPAWARLVPEMLKQAGYRSYHSGKWHIDGMPLENGFDRSYYLKDQGRFFNPEVHYEDDAQLPAVKPGSDFYATTAIADHAIKCLKEHETQYADQPFFHFLPFTAPHFPLHARQEDIARYKKTYRKDWEKIRKRRYHKQKRLGIISHELSEIERNLGPPYDFPEAMKILGPGEVNRPLPWKALTKEQQEFQADKMAIHAAMIDRMDRDIGRVLDQLRAMNAFDNTLIMFLSDNGASAEIMVRADGHDPHALPGSAATHLCLGPSCSTTSNTPFRKHKTWVHEGGISTPLIVHWPKGFEAKGELRHNTGHVVDLVPTFLELAGAAPFTTWEGVPVPPAPGISLLPVFTRDLTVSHEYFWWYHDGHRALRKGDWKLVASKNEPWELYNLKADRTEMNDLANASPDQVQELAYIWQQKHDAFKAVATQDLTTANSQPSIFLVKEKTAGFTSIEDLRNIDKNSHQGILWKDFIQQSAQDFEVPYIDPTVDFEGRDPVHLKHKNVSYDLARGVCERLARSALLFVVTEEEKYKDLVMRQIEALYDTTRWPMWCDDAHVRTPPHVDIRTYRISMWVALCYNWMQDKLTDSEKAWIIKGLNQRAIQPFWEKLAQKPGWYVHRHNWFTNMFGGMGITAMALGDAHPETGRLLDTIVPQMINFNDTFGEMGEFNEPPGYAGAVRFSVEFAEAYRYYTKNERNLLTEKPFPEVCYWIMYHTLPPGRMMPFGDTNNDQPLSSPAVIAAAANANNDGILQGYYLNNFKGMKSPMELFWFNPNLKPVSPAGKLPLGIAYKEHGAELISRTSWDPVSTACVVYGKAGRETNHDDNDVGQLCIDGFGERLIIDPGKPKPIYPKDYFSKTQYNYYSRSSQGHNVLVIGGEEMISEPNEEARGTCLKSWLSDSIGSSWELDLTPVYGNASKVTRNVAHLFPGIVVVHDFAELPKAENIDLRWHCITPPEWDSNGNFKVVGEKAILSAKVISLDENTLRFSTGHQEFLPPYHLTRQGDPLEQHYEPFVKVSTRGTSCSILTLFSVSENNGTPPVWHKTNAGYEIVSNGEKYLVTISGNRIEVSASGGKRISME